MVPLVARLPAHSLRLGAAGFLAVTALLGTTTSTLGDPATACAAPKKPGFDPGGYQTCVDIADDQWERSEITEKDFNDALWDCCYDNGGEVVTDNQGLISCVAPPEDTPAQLPRFPFPGDVTATLTPAPSPPPAGPIAPLPGVPPVQTG